MYNFITICTKKASTDPWHHDAYADISAHITNCVEDYITVTGNSYTDISFVTNEDELTMTSTWPFANEADFNTWKGLIEARDTYSAMVAVMDSFVDETDDRYKWVDNIWYFESDFPNW